MLYFLFFLLSDSQTTRGFDADVIFIDESEFVKRDLWLNTILPLHLQEKTSILAATTPQDNTSYNSFLISLKDPETNEHIFNVVNLFEVCIKCRAGDKPWQCTHQPDRISGSKTRKSRDITKLFYSDGDGEIGGRELYGVGNKNTNNLLLTRLVQQFRKSSVKIQRRVRALYLAIDPGGGGPGDLGIVGVAETNGEQGPRLAVIFNFLFVVVGIWVQFRHNHHDTAVVRWFAVANNWLNCQRTTQAHQKHVLAQRLSTFL